MENLISKWKVTVENHNKKLSQLREDSLGASQHRSSRTSSLGPARDLGLNSLFLTGHGASFGQVQQNLLASTKTAHVMRSLSSSSGDSAGKTKKENRVPNYPVQQQQSHIIQSGSEEEQSLNTLIESLFQLFPESATLKHKPRLTQDLQALIRNNSLYSKNFSKLSALRQEIKHSEQLRREQIHKNEEATKRVSELESKLQESERDRQRLRKDKDSLHIQIQDASEVQGEKAKQEEIIQILKRSQEALEVGNQRLEQTYIDSKRRYREKEEQWELEMKTVRTMLQQQSDVNNQV